MNKKSWQCRLKWHMWDYYDVEADKKDFYIDFNKCCGARTTRRKCLLCGKEQRAREQPKQIPGGLYYIKYIDAEKKPLDEKIWKRQYKFWWWAFATGMILAFFAWVVHDVLVYYNEISPVTAPVGELILVVLVFLGLMCVIRNFQY